MTIPTTPSKSRVAILVDCENTNPKILELALKKAAESGRVVLQRGYGNHATLGSTWQAALLKHGFSPQLHYQYVPGKNTADIALALDALEAMLEGKADTFFLITSDSDFIDLSRKLRERGATVCIVGESKTPEALQKACDQFFAWVAEAPAKASPAKALPKSVAGAKTKPKQAEPIVKRSPGFVIEAVKVLGNSTPDGKVGLSQLGQYMREAHPGFTPGAHGHSTLLKMLKTYDSLTLEEAGGHHTVQFRAGSQTSATTAS